MTAAPPSGPKSKPPLSYLTGTVHVLKVVDLQVRKLRRQELVASASPGRKVGYSGINVPLARYQIPDPDSGDPPLTVLEVVTRGAPRWRASPPGWPP